MTKLDKETAADIRKEGEDFRKSDPECHECEIYPCDGDMYDLCTEIKRYHESQTVHPRYVPAE